MLVLAVFGRGRVLATQAQGQEGVLKLEPAHRLQGGRAPELVWRCGAMFELERPQALGRRRR